MLDKVESAALVMENNRLKVEIAYPGALYDGSRFDWMGWIKQVTLEGKHTFCSQESLQDGHGSGGFGLCSEFGIFEPIGFEDCEPGDVFPKLGVGLLLRQDAEEYDFMHPYRVTPFPVVVEQQADGSLLFVSEPLACRGYEVAYSKKIRLDDNRLILDFELHNRGSRTIKTTEYNHNFVSINEKKVGPGYALDLPYQSAVMERAHPLLKDRNGTLYWQDEPQANEAFYALTRAFKPNDAEKSTWTLIHEPSGVGMSETLDRPLLRFAVWGEKHVVSPELFHEVLLEPGQALHWSRTYTFFDRSEKA
jgi:hypothetical protein